MKAQRTIITLLGAALCAVALSRPAKAQSRVDTLEYTGPDRTMLRSGLWTLGLSYVPAVIVGVESPLPEDRFLFVPVAGPWVDFARRDCPTCDHETLNQVLLVTDGIVQGVGALDILGSFLFIEHTTVSRTALRRDESKKRAFELHVTPARVGGTYGLAASGKF
jgi:hypothetical protein